MQKHFLPKITRERSHSFNEKFTLVYAVHNDDREDPISDIGLTSKIQITNVTPHKADLKLKILPPIPDPQAPNFEEILKKKVKLCKKICNFSSPAYDVEAKNIKTNTLKEILTLIQTAKTIRGISPSLIKDMIKMCMKNMYRKMPSINNTLLYYEELPCFIDPSWIHLSFVYQIYKKIMHVIPCNEYFSMKWMKILMGQLKSPFLLERDEVIQIIIEHVKDHEEEMDNTIAYIIYLIAEHKENHQHPYMINSCLEAIYGINYMQDYYSNFYFTHFYFLLIPMLSDHHLLCFEVGMDKIIDDYLSHYPNNVKDLVSSIIRYIPKNGGNRQVAALKILIKTLPYLVASTFSPPLRKSIECFSEAINSNSVNVARFALFSLTDNIFVPIFKDHPKKIFPILIPKIRYIKANHWSHRVRDTATYCLQHLIKLDSKYAKDTALVINEELTGHVHLHSWVGISRLAALNDCSINLGQKLSEISSMFKSNASINAIIQTARRPAANLVRVPMKRSQLQTHSATKFGA